MVQPAISKRIVASDTSKMGQELAMAIGMGLPMMGMMTAQQDPQMARVFTMLGKLAPVVAELDFELSRSSTSRLDGDRWITKYVVNYKEYTPPKKEDVPDLAKQREEEKKVKSSLEGL